MDAQIPSPLLNLPHEIWLLVFKYLPNHSDLLACNRGSEKWAEDPTLSPLYMFKEVFKVKMKRISKNNFLKCRLVCKTWKEAIDKIYETHQLHLTFNDDPLHLHPANMQLKNHLRWNHDGIRLSSSENINTFIATMNTQLMSPFIVRCVEFDDDGSPEFWDCVCNFLRVFGDFIWYVYFKLRFQSHDAFAGATSNEQVVQNCLVLLPNIKKLFLDANPSWINFIGENQKEFLRVQEYLRTNPLPQLANLQMIYFDPTNHWTPLHEAIIRCGSNTLKKLDFRHYIYDGSISLPQLEEVHITVERSEHLENLVHFPASMKTIYISTVHNRGIFLTAEEIFTRLERFSRTLKELFLEVQLVALPSDFRANFLSLEKLTIRVSGPLDFLLGLRHLKELDIFEYDDHPSNEGCIRVNGIEDKMLQSNIWDLIPSLQLLAFEGEMFYRKDLPELIILD